MINNLQKGLDFPGWEQLTTMLTASIAGNSWCNDLRGTNPYSYATMGSVNVFGRYDSVGNTWATLVNTGGAVGNPGCALAYDPTYGTAGGVWSALGAGNANISFSVYNIATSVWTSRAVPFVGFVNQGGAICHTCSSYSSSANDDYIYYAGTFNNSTLWRYSIAGNSWSAMTNLPFSCQPGMQLLYNPFWDAGKLIYIRGGGFSDIYTYNIATNNYSAINWTPQGETFDVATTAAVRWGTNQIILQASNTLRFFTLDLSTAVLSPLHKYDHIVPSNAFDGNRMIYTKNTAQNLEFLSVNISGTTSMVRTQIWTPT